MSSPDPASWYVKIGDSEYGPYTGNQLKQYAAEGRITHDALVRQGKSMWSLAGSIDGLFHSPPPPASSSRPNPVDWNAIVRKPVAAPSQKSDPTKWIIVGLLGTIAACVLLATLVYVVLPIVVVAGAANVIANASEQARRAESQRPPPKAAPRSIPDPFSIPPSSMRGLATDDDPTVPLPSAMEMPELQGEEPAIEPETEGLRLEFNDRLTFAMEEPHNVPKSLPDLTHLANTLADASRIYNASVNAYSAAPSTADRDEVLVEQSAKALEWARSLHKKCIGIEIVVKDVVMHEGIRYAVVETVPELVPYSKATRQTVIHPMRISLDSTNERVIPGATLRVLCDLVPTIHSVDEYYHSDAIRNPKLVSGKSRLFDLIFLPNSITDGRTVGETMKNGRQTLVDGQWFCVCFTLHSIDILEVVPPESKR